MIFSEHCIKRPVFTIVLSLLLVISGFLHYKKLGVRLLPNIDKPIVHIATDYQGASPELVEKEITIPIENALSGISGIDSIRSTSTLGKSRINIDFQLGVDINDTISDIRNKLSTIQAKLPQDSRPPTVSKNDADSNPVVMLGFHDDSKTPLQITDYVDRFIKPVLQEIKGVGEVVDHGARNYAVKIALDPIKMAAYQVTVAQVKRALTQQNIDVPSGQIKSSNRSYTVVTHARLRDAKRFADLVIAQHSNQPVHLGEIAAVTVGSENEDNLLRINGKPAVGLAILAQSTANPVDVAKEVKKTIASLQPTLPPHFDIQVVFDSTLFIKQSIHEVYKSFLEAVLFVAIVVFLFLGNLRAAIIPIITIPICLISAFWPMYLLGFELNTITLLAMVLAIGLVVDDAIVVLENCHRHMQSGLNAKEAAVRGSKEIVFVVLAMTITLAAVYAPMGFVSGFTGKLFLQFGITLAICVLISGLIALTLSPMMCSSLLRDGNGRYSAWLNKQFEKLGGYYFYSLKHVLTHPVKLAVVLLSTCLLGVFSYQQLGAELAPVEDQGYIIGALSAPTNSSLHYTDQYTRELESIYEAIPEKGIYLASVKPASAFTVLRLKPWEDRQRKQKDISNELSEKMQRITGVNVFPVSPNPLGQRVGNSQFSLALLGNTSYLRLNEMSSEIIKILDDYPGLRHLKSTLTLDSEQIEIEIDRQLAADLQVNLADVAELLSTMLGGSNPANFTYEGQAYKIILQVQQAERRDVAVLNKLYVQSGRGRMIPLSSLIRVHNTIGPDSLPHLNRMRSANITAELGPNAHFDEVIRDVKHLLHEKLPDDIQYRFTGVAKDYIESAGSSLYAFYLALLFIYLVLAAQFESFIDPFIVLLSVPLSLVGAVLSLYIFNESLSIYSNIAMITLIGLVTKHGIMITEFANQQLKLGQSKLNAVLKAAHIRLRPILMTTLAMILGALPLAIAVGAGSEGRQQLGLVIIGGMLVGTLFSLYIVPFAYLIISKRKVALPSEMSQASTISGEVQTT
ncbi:hydrophobic/amphiphilic exporter-1 (mainly G-bacteria), HAE1 family [Legionella lansingensis]|uniref:Hydrophobic/amphiphilic exporter-1 (Mainly G-bacteria), HAE1 family n=1 Tax=Legionella lansingensis TaxID=45067 RepID=A0A0W0VUV4_9GAMM|nr:efflux RND transporter permease subunit [Legionella lansingensis]KTD23741.1 hydrophobic/amphiphilic exporter-1 (mainly G- bacteria), HAE1 family [Legionella lansingensis]SNV47567.1 hydrophobic/amphiphilic exporter-1 (mainly G-bacteria), HAE1 family [Legionella lansingensis]